MKFTAADLLAFGIIDEVVAEKYPAHERPREVVMRVGKVIQRHLNAIDAQVQAEGDYEQLLQRRYQKFRTMGAYVEASG